MTKIPTSQTYVEGWLCRDPLLSMGTSRCYFYAEKRKPERFSDHGPWGWGDAASFNPEFCARLGVKLEPGQGPVRVRLPLMELIDSPVSGQTEEQAP